MDDACLCLNLYFASQHLFVRRPIYLSEHILGEMSEWYWHRPIGRRAHILFTLHTSCSFNSGKLLCLKKRLSLFCHSASQVTFTANNLTRWKKKEKHHRENMKSHFQRKKKCQRNLNIDKMNVVKLNHLKQKAFSLLESRKRLVLYLDFNWAAYKLLLKTSFSISIKGLSFSHLSSLQGKD